MNSSGNWGQTICIAERLKQAPSMGIRKLFGCHFLGVLNQYVQWISRTLNVSNKIVYSFSLRRFRMLSTSSFIELVGDYQPPCAFSSWIFLLDCFQIQFFSLCSTTPFSSLYSFFSFSILLCFLYTFVC